MSAPNRRTPLAGLDAAFLDDLGLTPSSESPDVTPAPPKPTRQATFKRRTAPPAVVTPAVDSTVAQAAPRPVNSEPKVRLNVDIPADLHRRLKIEAAEAGTTITALILAALGDR